jgi:hypothetical protein
LEARIMTFFPRICRSLYFTVLVLAAWVAGAGFAWAQDKGGAAQESGGVDYTLAYALVILGVVLGLLFVLRSSNRRERERPAGYVEKNLLKEE